MSFTPKARLTEPHERCTGCAAILPVWALIDGRCGHCAADPGDRHDDPPAPTWADVRARRNELLAACDFRFVSDRPEPAPAWRTYRQALRDITETYSTPAEVAWPDVPEE